MDLLDPLELLDQLVLLEVEDPEVLLVLVENVDPLEHQEHQVFLVL